MSKEEKLKPAPQNLRCGLVMPISAIDGCPESHWDAVKSIIKEALAETDFAVELVSNSNEIGIIQKRIVQNIYDNEMLIVDVSAKNPNVMFELGLRLAFDKPAIIIKDDKTNYSFDTSPIEHIEYPRDLNYHSIQGFKKKLKDKVIATFNASRNKDYTTFLGHFGTFVVAKLNEKEVGKEDYLIDSVSELRREMQNLAWLVSNNKPSSVSMSYFDEPTLPAGATSLSEAEFVKKTLSDLRVAFSPDEMIDTKSPAFKIILDEYCSRHVPQHISMKPRHKNSIGARLVEALAAQLAREGDIQR